MASFLRNQGQYLKAVLVGEFFGVTLVSYSYTMLASSALSQSKGKAFAIHKLILTCY